MDMKKLFHVLVVGGAVLGTGAGCSKDKPAQTGNSAPAAQTAPQDGTAPEKAAPGAKEGGGAAGW